PSTTPAPQTATRRPRHPPGHLRERRLLTSRRSLGNPVPAPQELMGRALRVIRLTVPAAARWGGAVDRGRKVTMAEDAVESREAGDQRTEALIQAFLRDGRLVRLPAKFTRRKEVLRYLA